MTNPRCPRVDDRFANVELENLLDHERPYKFQFDAFAIPWLMRASEAEENNNWFEALIYLWVTLNAWLGLAVNDRKYSGVDSYLWKSAALDQQFTNTFNHKLGSDKEFYGELERFYKLWPIFKTRTIIDLGLHIWGSRNHNESRETYRKLVFAINVNRWDYSPSCFLQHQDDPNSLDELCHKKIPLDWEHTLAAIYMVRCNLFHGGKGFYNSRDLEIVSLAYTILSGIWWAGLK